MILCGAKHKNINKFFCNYRHWYMGWVYTIYCVLFIFIWYRIAHLSASEYKQFQIYFVKLYDYQNESKDWSSFLWYLYCRRIGKFTWILWENGWFYNINLHNARVINMIFFLIRYLRLCTTCEINKVIQVFQFMFSITLTEKLY